MAPPVRVMRRLSPVHHRMINWACETLAQHAASSLALELTLAGSLGLNRARMTDLELEWVETLLERAKCMAITLPSLRRWL